MWNPWRKKKTTSKNTDAITHAEEYISELDHEIIEPSGMQASANFPLTDNPYAVDDTNYGGMSGMGNANFPLTENTYAVDDTNYGGMSGMGNANFPLTENTYAVDDTNYGGMSGMGNSQSFMNLLSGSDENFQKNYSDFYSDYKQNVCSGSSGFEKYVCSGSGIGKKDEEFYVGSQQNVFSGSGSGLGTDYSYEKCKGIVDDEEEDEDYEPEEEDEHDTDDASEGDGNDGDDEREAWYAKLQEFYDVFTDYCKWKNLKPPFTRGDDGRENAKTGWRFTNPRDVETGTGSSHDRWPSAGQPTFELSGDVFDEKFDPYGAGKLAVGSVFLSKKHVRKKVVEYLLGNRNAYKVDHSDKRRLWMDCRVTGCPFRVRASCAKTETVWTVYQFVEHSCEFDPRAVTRRTLPSKELGEIMADRIVTQGQFMIPAAIKKELLTNHGLVVSDAMARRIRAHGIAAIYGTEADSFKQVPSYLYMLRSKNPGSTTDYMVDECTRKFRFAFFALSASIAGFSHARPFIAIDGTHLKSKYRGILFVAVTKDPNNQIFPLAFGVGGVESRESWAWFLLQVRFSLHCPPQMLIVSDGSKAISGAVGDVFPDAHHVLCCYHIQQNLVAYGKRVVELFKRAAWSYTDDEYIKAMADLESCCPPAARHLKGVVGEERFARVKCSVRRYDIMTTNIVESMNNKLNWARRLPICSLLEAARCIVEQWFAARHARALESPGPLTEYATIKLRSAMDAGSRMSVVPQSEIEMRVKHDKNVYRVVLSNAQCSCNVFQHDMIPCAHAAAAIRHCRHNPISYVDDHFKVEHLRTMWSGSVMPVPSPSEWVVPNDVRDAICEPPDNPRQAGRPRMRRHPGGVEGGERRRQVQKCKRCGEIGHNAKTCIADPPENTNAVQRMRARKKCRLCGGEGHTAPRCPMRVQLDLNEPAQ